MEIKPETQISEHYDVRANLHKRWLFEGHIFETSIEHSTLKFKMKCTKKMLTGVQLGTYRAATFLKRSIIKLWYILVFVTNVFFADFTKLYETVFHFLELRNDFSKFPRTCNSSPSE